MQQFGELKMLGTPPSAGRTPHSFSDINGKGQGEDLGTNMDPSNDSTECDSMEFTMDDIEVLLNEKMRVKSRYNFKEKCENMTEYIRRLRLCIRWFQEVVGSYVLEQEKLLSSLNLAELKRNEMEMQLKNKEEELNAVIGDLRKNNAGLQGRLAKEESDKLVAMDCLAREKKARIDAEKGQDSLSDELAIAQFELITVSEQMSSLNNMYKNLQEHSRSLQEYNGQLHTDLTTANECIRREEREKNSIMKNLDTLRGEHNLLQERFASCKASQNEAIKQKESLSNEITCLRGEMQIVRDDRDRQLLQIQVLSSEMEKYKEDAEKYSSESNKLAIKSNKLEGELQIVKDDRDHQLLQIQILSSEMVEKYKEDAERYSSELNKLATRSNKLEGELQMVSDDRDQQLLQIQVLSSEIEKYKEDAERYSSELNNMAINSSKLEESCLLQSNEIRTLTDQLTVTQKKLEVNNISARVTIAEFEEQKKFINNLENCLADAEFKLIEGERLRKKLHNTILELKGNIRVFCRVRPMLTDDGPGSEEKVISFPTSTEAYGRGVDLMQNGQKHSFTFDKVFMPDASQEDVFEEISQLVQSALDGYKVCIFAYGQTGSGKTYTMMGRPGNQEEKGLIPRSLEQIFQTRQLLQSQGWKFDMQVSMLEIYNETIRDLLSTNRSDQSRPENGAKQYAIKLDMNGSPTIPDLTVVDVRSSKEASFLLDQAAQNRAVGKTLVNERSSRSHLVFTLRISGVNESTEQQVQGVLNLIDLAGSERLSKSGSTGNRLKETQAINKSLSSLSDVIFALAKKEDHIPFRNSKLTYLLQPCLGGDSKVLMFVNISPDSSSLGESLCSARFAARVNSCEIGVPRRETSIRSFDRRMSYS